MAQKPRKARSPVPGIVSQLKADVDALAGRTRALDLSSQGLQKLNQGLTEASSDLDRLVAELDPVKRPRELFDPGNPRTIGYFVALAMTAQPRRPLTALRSMYGSGVYAIYYRGDFPLYAPISRSETPIYVGQAAPGNEIARTPVQQGTKLYDRLVYHRGTISRAAATVSIDDFDYRALVVQTGWETAAEDYLIRLHRPIWNKETRILQGFGKHGDDPEKRKNRVSSWDVIHEGRKAAGHAVNPKQKTPEKIAEQLAEHFKNTPAFQTTEEILSGFIVGLRQTELEAEPESAVPERSEEQP